MKTHKHHATRDTAEPKKNVYVDKRGNAEGAIPVQDDKQTNCRKATKRQ